MKMFSSIEKNHGKKSPSMVRERNFCGKSPETGDLFPSIPRSENSPGISHVVKEIFQEYLKDDVPSYEYGQNMQITCKDNERLKQYADNIVMMYENHNEALKDIASVEELMMKHHAKYILKKDKIQENALVNKMMDLKQRRIFGPLGEKILRKYPLIDANDVFQQDIHGNFGFLKDEPDAISKFLLSDQRSIMSDILSQPKPVLHGKRVKQIKKMKKKENVQKLDWISSRKRYVPKPKEQALRIMPNQVIFTCYERGGVYEESIQIQNVGKSVARIQVVPFKEDSAFKLKWTEKLGGTIVIAPGLYIIAKVEFYCNSLDDAADQLILKVQEGQDVVVPTLAKRPAPVLEALDTGSLAYPVLWSVEKGTVATLECGMQLVGENVIYYVKLINTGGEGGFWIMTEEDWINWEVKDGLLNNVLKFPPFTITPFYFFLQQMEEITICVVYEPEVFGLQVEHLKVLCDNCVVHTLDILADAVYFESQFVSFANLKKSFPIEVDDDIYADYYFNIGRILPNGCVEKSFFLSNESDLELRFHWKKRFIQFSDVRKYPPHSLLQIPLECITIIPSEGKLSPNSDQHFTIKCMLNNGKRGHYRGILSFFVEDLPWQSISRASDVRQVVVNSDNVDRVDVLVNEIELWVECVPLAIMLQPCVIKITGGKLRCNEEPVIPKITLANTTLDDIIFHWLPISSPLAEPAAESIIDVFVKVGSIKTKTFMPCPLKVTPLSQGLLLHEIRCSINEGEKSVEMIICAQVGEPQIFLSKYILNFGSTPKNTCTSQKIKINNGSNTSVVWVAREFKYDFETGALKPMTRCRLSAESGIFYHVNSASTVEYTLDTKNTGIWISIIELSIVSLSRRYRQHFILVVGDVQETQLTVTAPPRSTAILRPGNPLFLGIPIVTNVILHNHSDILGTFKWGIPLGQDIHNLRFDIKPRSGIIKPWETVTLKVFIVPLQLGHVKSFYVPCFSENMKDPIVLGVKCEIKGVSVTFTLPVSDFEGKETYTNVHIPWSTHDKIEFQPEVEHPMGTEECEWCIDESVEDFYFKYSDKDSQTRQIIPTQPQQNQCADKEQVIKNIEFEHQEPGNQTYVNDDSKTENESEDESEDVALDGKIGKLKKEEEWHLLLNFCLWENTDCMQTHFYTNYNDRNDQIVNEYESNVEEEFPAPEIPPTHVYPLADEETILNSSSSSINFSDSVVAQDAGENFSNRPQQQIKSSSTSSEIRKFSSQLKKSNSIGQKISKELDILHTRPNNTVVREITMKNVNIKQIAVTKFFIKNETPIYAQTDVKATRFPPNKFIRMEEIIESVYCEISHKQRDKLECCILQGNGIVVFVKQSSEMLKPYDPLIVELIVYADTWGIYYETIVCNISGLQPFYIKLTIEVHGSPVYFAFIHPDTTVPHPLRFGTMRYGSEPRLRSLHVCNESSISLTIVWHIFMKELPVLKGEGKKRKDLPFNLVIDIYTAIKDIGCNVQCLNIDGNPCALCIRDDDESNEVLEINLIPPIGKEDYTLFQAFPQETIIDPKSTQIINLSFKPPNKNFLENTASFWAYLVGFIKVTPKNTYSRGCFYRPYGRNLQPVCALLHAEVEMPSLSLVSDSDDLEFLVEAANVLNQPNKQLILSRYIVVKNNCKSPITALVDTDEPFKITEVNTMAHRNITIVSDEKEDIVFTLLPEECVEIHVSCIIQGEYLDRIQNVFWHAIEREYSKEERDTYRKKSAVIESPLQLVQPDIMEQTIKLKLVIEFPILTVSTQKIDFGPVYVGHTKWTVFEVGNYTVSHVWFHVQKMYQINEFSLKPMCGVLAPAPIQGHSSLQIKVTFTPTESISYMDYLRLETCIRGDERIIIVEGLGTTDTKFGNLI